MSRVVHLWVGSLLIVGVVACGGESDKSGEKEGTGAAGEAGSHQAGSSGAENSGGSDEGQGGALNAGKGGAHASGGSSVGMGGRADPGGSGGVSSRGGTRSVAGSTSNPHGGSVEPGSGGRVDTNGGATNPGHGGATEPSGGATDPGVGGGVSGASSGGGGGAAGTEMAGASSGGAAGEQGIGGEGVGGKGEGGDAGRGGSAGELGVGGNHGYTACDPDAPAPGCNGDPMSSMILGQCQEDGTCLCIDGYIPHPVTGRCIAPRGDCGDPEVMERYPACVASTSEADCTELGGTWQERVRQGQPTPGDYECVCPTGDERCSCISSSECLGVCSAISSDLEVCSVFKTGRCGQYTGGCLVMLDQDSQCVGVCD